MPLLNQEDIAFAANAEIMYTKNRIIDAVYQLFGQLAEQYVQAANLLPARLITISPKIAKGENYLGLPWVMLDYPRNFSNEQIVAVRTLFWWGHSFSIHLLLQPAPLVYTEQALELLSNFGWHFSKADTLWNHHFNQDELVLVENLTSVQMQEQGSKNGFWKWSIQLPVMEWQKAPSFLHEKFSEAVTVLAAIYKQ